MYPKKSTDKCQGLDFKVNLQRLKLDNTLSSWIQKIETNPLMGGLRTEKSDHIDVHPTMAKKINSLWEKKQSESSIIKSPTPTKKNSSPSVKTQVINNISRLIFKWEILLVKLKMMVLENDSLDYNHSLKMLKLFHRVFGLYNICPNQLQAINSSLLKYDTFILMPTGGQSLCYQLLAILYQCVTIVVSPIRSLITDQVKKLTSLEIPAAHSLGVFCQKHINDVTRELSSIKPNLKLLYVTPEKIKASKIVASIMIFVLIIKDLNY